MQPKTFDVEHVHDAPRAEWETCAPEAENLDRALLDRALENLTRHCPAWHSFLIVRHGRIAYERLNPNARVDRLSALLQRALARLATLREFPGDTFRDQYDDLWNLRSVTESILSILVGIAFDQDYVRLDQRVCDLLPELFDASVDSAKKRITVRHLLTMTSGLKSVEHGLLPLRVLMSPNWLKFMLAQPLEHAPGETYAFNPTNAHLLSALLTRATGQSTLQFARARLFEPLGIEQLHWERDPQGIFFGAGNLFLSPRDLAKLGQLYLHRGKWGRAQLVSEHWVDESLQPRRKCGSGFQHGYLWYIKDEVECPRGKKFVTYSAAGSGGQRIIIIPKLGLVFVTTARAELLSDTSYWLNLIICRDVLPAVRDLEE
jgi:CubicO group peptidase (beta-lactamase class C family)